MENIKEKIEDKVMDAISSGIAGRLIVFKPEKGIFGADLAVERRGKYKESEMYFQVNSIVLPVKDGKFIKDFPQEKYEANKNFYLIFVCFDEVAQKIGDYVWLIPSLYFKDIAEVVKFTEGNMFRFEAPIELKDNNKYSSFLISTKELGKSILDAFENKGKFVFKQTGFSEKKTINIENLSEFLCEARRNTYAANNTPVDNARLLGSVQLEFQKGVYFYQDIYFSGNKKLIGLEIIYQDLNPIWYMNYSGTVLEKLETAFLKESLFKLSEKCRLGGVCEYEKRELKYQDQGQGDLADFYGIEKIFMKGKDIYKLNYQGGMTSDKL